jgi:uncharacterized repeat protein (TIGR03803 family)
MRQKTFWLMMTRILAVLTMALMLPTEAAAASKYKVLHRFKGKDGAYPQAGLILDAAGNLYGTTSSGGDLRACHRMGCGTVFKLTPQEDGTWRENVLHSFTGTPDGLYPHGGLVFDQAGNLYGTTPAGGASDAGVVFELMPKADGSWRESVLYTFCSVTNCTDGDSPRAGLVLDQAGHLYGTTVYGGSASNGTAFRLTPNSDGTWKESVLYSFCALNRCPDGANPFAGLTFGAAGTLYGTTFSGGGGGGVVFKLTPNKDGSWRESVLHHFCSRTNCDDGFYPASGVIFDQSGNLYSTTARGGASDAGVVFELMPKADGSWRESVLHHFCSRTNCDDGAEPYASVIFDQSGNLYGTTVFGGNLSYCSGSGCGVVFKLAPNSEGGWRETVLHFFTDRAGASPNDVIFDAGGHLYGTDEGSATLGSVFEISPLSIGEKSR